MSTQGRNVLIHGTRRGPRGVPGARWLAVLGIGVLAAGFVLAIAGPAQAGESGGEGCATSVPEVTTTVTSTETAVTSTMTSTESTESTVTTTLTTTGSTGSGGTTTLTSTESTSTEVTSTVTSTGPSAPLDIPANCIAARVQWNGSAGGTATIWITRPGSEESSNESSEHIVIAAGDTATLATLLLEYVESGWDFDSVQIHQSLSSPGDFQSPTAIIDGGGYGDVFTLSGPVCSGDECVWTIEYNPPVSYLRAPGHALRAVAGPFRGPVVTITNVGRPKGGGAPVPTIATAPLPTPTTTPAPTTSFPVVTASPEIGVLGESESEDPGPPETVVVAGLAETGVGVARYVSISILLMLLGAVMLIVAAGGRRRRERR